MKVKLSPTQIIQKLYDSVSDAIRVKISDTEFNMQLDHNDGDSVYVFKKPIEHKILLNPNEEKTLDFDFSHCSEISFIDSNVEVKKSNDGINFTSATSGNIFCKKISMKNLFM